MNKHVKNALFGTSAAALFVGTASCGGDESESKSALIGDWSVYVDREDGEPIPDRSNEEQFSYRVIMSFSEDGEFEYCFQYGYKYTFEEGETPARQDDFGFKYYETRCTFSDWEWLDKREQIISIDFFDAEDINTRQNGPGGPPPSGFEIDLSELSKDSMMGEVTITYLYPIGYDPSTESYIYDESFEFEAYPVGSDEDLAKQEELEIREINK